MRNPPLTPEGDSHGLLQKKMEQVDDDPSGSVTMTSKCKHSSDIQESTRSSHNADANACITFRSDDNDVRVFDNKTDTSFRDFTEMITTNTTGTGSKAMPMDRVLPTVSDCHMNQVYESSDVCVESSCLDEKHQSHELDCRMLCSINVDSVQNSEDKSSDAPEKLTVSEDKIHNKECFPLRGLWDHPAEFFLSCLGYTVGLEAVWRFPHLMSVHGGGAFLLPYFLCLLTLGIPLLYLEMCMGQYVSLGPTHVWCVAPMAGGIGYVMVALCILVSCYHNVFMSWLLYYLFTSMSPQPPWLHCNNSWNTQKCCEYKYYIDNCTSLYPMKFSENSTCYVCFDQVLDVNVSIEVILEGQEYNPVRNHSALNTFEGIENPTDIIMSMANMTVSPGEEFFHNAVLDLSSGAEELGIIQWRLFVCLLLSGTIVYICVFMGVKSLGKVAYVSSLVPYFILLGLLIKCSSLDGAREGILYFLQPHWYRLSDPQVWKDAAIQVILSLGTSYGGIITLASYNAFSYNFYRTVMLIPLLSSLSCILAGCLVFTAIGHMSWQVGAPIDHISVEKFTLTFITYPEALSRDHHVMVTFFYIMLLMMCLARVLPCYLTIISSVLDHHPKLHNSRLKLALVGLIVCVIMVLCSVPLTAQGGLYFIEIISIYSTTWPVYVLGMVECLVIIWIYKFKHLQNNVWLMIGKRPGKWWFAMWGVITPIILLTLLLFSIAVYTPLSYNNKLMPWACNLAAWTITGLLLVIIPIYGVYAVSSHSGTLKQRIETLTHQPKKWGPSGKFADFLSHHFWTVPDYMVSEQEQIHDPMVWSRHHSLATTSDGELESISTMEGNNMAPPGAQKGDNIDTGSIQWSEDENKFRGNWTGRFDFIFSGLGYSIGVGNVWRFPYVVYKNGGGAFFVPYLMMLVLCGIPLLYMELALGQFSSVGPITMWKVLPLFKGVGYAAVITLVMVCFYYNVFTAWSVYYIVASMTTNLPWTTCNNSWNTPDCRERSFYNQMICTDNNTLIEDDVTMATSWNETMYPSTMSMTTFSIERENNTKCQSLIRNYSSPSAEYFFNQVLGVSSGIDEPGEIQWHLALSLLFCWTLTFVGLIKGVKSTGKVVYVTVLLPCIILLMLFIRFITLDSDAYLDGIKYYVTPQWDRLSQAGVWGDAASQLFFSLGLCMGGLVALGSYNRFHYDCYKDAYLICCMDTVTSVFSGFVIFSILGVLAREKGTDVANVVESSFGLAFIVYPEAVTRLPYSTAWSLLFFLMMFMLAVDSHFLMMEAVVIAIMDEFPKYLWKWRIHVILALCTSMYLLGLVFVTQGGIYFLVLVDAHVAAWSPLVIGILMCIGIAWVYHVDNFSENIGSMHGDNPGWWWKFMWRLVTPAVLVFILLFSWIMYAPVKMDDYQYPIWAQVLGIFMSLAPILCIPITLAVQLIPAKQPCLEAICDQAQPDPEWGPALEKHRTACYIPSVVQSDEQIARINDWLCTGHVYKEDEPDSTDKVTEMDAIKKNPSHSKTTYLENHRHSIAGCGGQSSIPVVVKKIAKRSLSDGDGVPQIHTSEMMTKFPRMKGKASGHRVTFKHNIDHKDVAIASMKRIKTQKNAGTQTRAMAATNRERNGVCKNKGTMTTRADLYGHENSAFDTDLTEQDINS